jgi:hypothetical protein
VYRFPPGPPAEPPPHFRCTVYRPGPPARPHRISFRPPLLHRPHLPAGHGLKSSAALIAPRLCTGLHRVAGPKGNLMEEGRGSWPEAVEQNRGPHLTSALLSQRSERCTVYRFRPGPPAGPHRISFRPPLPHSRHLPAGHGWKIPPSPIASRLRTPPPQSGRPKRLARFSGHRHITSRRR